MLHCSHAGKGYPRASRALLTNTHDASYFLQLSYSNRGKYHDNPATPTPPKQGSSCNQRGSSSRFVFESGWNLLLGLIIARKTVNARLDQDQAELRVLVLAVRLQVLSYGNRLFDQMPQVLWDFGSKTCAKQPCVPVSMSLLQREKETHRLT